MKPIFKEEKEFLERSLKVKLPDFCWRSGSKIYLNHSDDSYILQFQIVDSILLIKNNKIKNVEGKLVELEYKKGKKIINETIVNKTWEEEYAEREDHIMYLEKESISETKKYILNHKGYRLRPSVSGGKDSDLMFNMFEKSLEELKKEGYEKEYDLSYVIDMFNTTNDTAQTYLHAKNTYSHKGLKIHSPEIGWHRWLKEVKNYYLPTVMVRNCCSTYKEGQAKKVYDKNEKYIIFAGMRKYESQKRAFYNWDLNEAYKKAGKKLAMPKDWKRFLPIVNWTDEDVWLYIVHNNIEVNHMYKLGFNRCGCLLCPYGSDYNDLLIKEHYPLYMERWSEIVGKNYDLYNVKNRLKWSREEFINGKWKAGIGKEQEIIQKKATKENIQELAKLKSISFELAEKYFKRGCSCGKKLNPDEVAMFLKRMGRLEKVEDKREYLCKKCLCELLNITTKEYEQQVMSFREQGCELF